MRSKPILVGLQVADEALRMDLAAFFSAQMGYQLQNLHDAALPQLMIIDLETDWNQTLSRIQAIRSRSPHTEIFATAATADTTVLLNVLRAGVQEFLPQPVQKEELYDALERFEMRDQDRVSSLAGSGKLINMMGGKGGVGTTTLAVNLAVSLQEINPASSVVLVDLNVQFGDVALYLDLDPTYTFWDITADPSRVDEAFLTSLLSRHPSGLYVLPSADRMMEINLQTVECVERSLEVLQQRFDYVILDSGNLIDDIAITALHRPSTLLLISTLTLPSIRNIKRLIDYLSEINYPNERIEFIINRYKSKHEMSLKKFENSLQQEPFSIIPNDYTSVSNSVSKGKSLSMINRQAKITKSIRNLAIKLSEGNQKKSFFSQFFKRNK
jgi:pilus assembly protein CpaE